MSFVLEFLPNTLRMSGEKAENRDQTVVRKHGSQSAAVASTSRQHASHIAIPEHTFPVSSIH